MALVGIIVVLVAVIGGFMFAGGNPILLFQPAEFIVILGAAAGSLLIMANKSTVKKMMAAIPGIFKAHAQTKQDYLDLLKTFYDLFVLAQKEGIIGIERHIEKPKESEILNKNKILMHNDYIQDFFCDTMKLILTGLSYTDVENVLDNDIEVYEEERKIVPAKIGSVADSLPGLGIVAAVLGIIITMKSIDQGAEVVGEHVAAALVGTFLGILFCYGFLGPMAANVEHSVEEEILYLKTIKSCIVSFSKGNAPIITVELARRTIFSEFRPSFSELENYVRNKP